MLFLILMSLVCYAAGQASDAEIREISALIWSRDNNRFPPQDLTYNLAGPRLFTYVNDGRFGTPSFKWFRDLRKHYNPHTGQAESCDASCQSDMTNFIDTIMETLPMQTAWQFLADKGLSPSNEADFKQELRNYWFNYYSRGGVLDSSGFEHVLLGEIHNNAVSGFHNWVAAYEEEKIENFQYGNPGSSDLCDPEVAKFNFNWLGHTKSISSMWMYTSPEVELALYHLCFMARRNTACRTELDGHALTVTTFDIQRDGNTYVGTAYPNC